MNGSHSYTLYRTFKIFKKQRGKTSPRGYKTFFVLISAEREILNAHKYKNIKKFSFCQLDERTAPRTALWIRSVEARGETSLGEWEHNNNNKLLSGPYKARMLFILLINAKMPTIADETTLVSPHTRQTLHFSRCCKLPCEFFEAGKSVLFICRQRIRWAHDNKTIMNQR